MIADFLVHKGRSDFIGLLCDTSVTNTQRREALGLQLESRKIRWMSSNYESEATAQESRSIRSAMKRIKERGYRTIVICQSNPLSTFQQIADAAQELEMNRGEHFYVWFDEFELPNALGINSNVSKIVEGSVWVMPPPMSYLGVDFAFPKVWAEQGEDLVNSVNTLNPVPEGSPGHIHASSDYFQKTPPEYGSGKP